jgi:hypothetical protein
MAWTPFRPLRALLLCLAPAAAAAADCAALREEGRSVAQTITLQGVPGQHYRGWLQEGGRELRLRDRGRLLAAAPSRRARLPLWLRADASGRLRLAIAVGSGPEDARWRLQLDCADAADPQARALARINRLAARHLADADAATGWRLALALFRTAAAHREDAALQLWLLQQQVGLARRVGLMEQAAGWAALLAAQAEAQGRPAERALALLDRGSALLLIDGVEAERILAEVERPLAEFGWPHLAALARQERCVLARLRGELEAAIACYRDVVARFAAGQEYRAQINAQNNLTTALFAAGRFAEGRAVLDANRELVATHGNAFYRARVATIDAQLATWAGDFDHAFRALFEARAIFQQLREHRHVAQTDRLLGDRYTLAGETGRALDYYRRARRSLSELGMQRIAAMAVLSEARSLASVGDLDTALALANEAERSLRDAPNRYDWRNAVIGIADFEARLGRRGAALAWLAQLDGALSVPQARHRQALLAQLDAPEAPTDATLREWLEADLAEARLVQALTIARVLVQRLIDNGSTGEAEAVIARVDLAVRAAVSGLRSPGVRDAMLRELQALHAARTATWPEGPVASDAALRLVAALDALIPAGEAGHDADDALLALERRIGEDLLGAAAGGDPVQRDRALVELPAMAARVGVVDPAGHPLSLPAALTLAYPVMRQDHGGLLIHQAGAWRWQPIDLAGLRRARKALHAALAEGHADLDALAATLVEVDAALRLARWLPGEQPLALVAHAELAGLPLEWLLQRRDVQAATTWLHRLQADATLRPARVLLVAASPEGEAALPRLAATAEELEAVRSQWPGRVDVEPGRTRLALLAALREPGALVHVAAHGRSARQRHEESGLWLQDEAGAPDFVSALRLRRSPARAAMVVLSACETGYSPAQSGLGFGGVAASLAEAGVAAVVAARWPVGDRTARAFAEHFHRALAAQPERPELALQVAQQALRATAATRHPTHWAGWFLLRQGLPKAP